MHDNDIERLLDPERAQRTADRANRRQAKHYPLFASTGVLDQVVAPKTADDVLTQHRNWLQAQSEWAERQARQIAAYREALLACVGPERLDQMLAAFAASRRPQSGEYLADYLNNALAAATGRTPREVFDEYNLAA